MNRHVNIPIFIPHEGCANQCVFCNQRTITGVEKQCDDGVSMQIDTALSTVDRDDDVEIAFFGGSFTGIGIERMTHLCDIAYGYIKQGKVRSIRLSTRPDYIDEHILTILKDRGVTHIELGIQSMSQKVLDACKRGHTTQDTERACRLINDYGFILGGQMMIGLPCSTLEDELYTAEKIISMGCCESRIYPCVVFHKTELCEMSKNGEYTPLCLEDAVERSSMVYDVLHNGNVKVLRIGLQSSENLSDENEVYAGANHPALGELVLSRHYYNMVSDEIDNIKNNPKLRYKGKVLLIDCAPQDLSKVIGQNKHNKSKILDKALSAGFSGIRIICDTNIQINDLYIHF